jgi:hypothetical protein
MNSLNILKIAAIALPLIIFGVMVNHHIKHQKQAEIWRIDIQGFDPRDILKGRFGRFQFDWNMAYNKQQNTPGHKLNCLCLNDVSGNKINPQAQPLPCDDIQPRQCDAVLEGRLRGENFDIGIRQFFLDERKAPILDKLLRGGKESFAVELLIRPSDHSNQGKGVHIERNAQMGSLFVNGKSADAFLEEYEKRPAE